MATQHRNVISTTTFRRVAARLLYSWSSGLGANCSGSIVDASRGASPTRTPPEAGSGASETSSFAAGSRSARRRSSGSAARFVDEVAREPPITREPTLDIPTGVGGGGPLLRCFPREIASDPAPAYSRTRTSTSARRSPVPPLNDAAVVRCDSSCARSRRGRVKYSQNAATASKKRRTRRKHAFFSWRRAMLSSSVLVRKNDARAIAREGKVPAARA